MKKYILPFLPLLAIIVGVVAAFGTGGADEPTEPVVLGEEDLMEQVEIWRNQYRRMTPGDGPLVQNVGELPAAWEEFGNRWSSAPAERDLATWLVPFSAERQGDTTIIRDASGAVLWSGTTDFAKPDSTNVTITGALVDETDWPLYDASRREVLRRLSADRPCLRDGEGGGTNDNSTNNPNNMFVSAYGVFTNDVPEFHVGLQWTNDVTLDIWVFAPVATPVEYEHVWTNDENVVVTNIGTNWHTTPPGLTGLDHGWEYAGTISLTNGEKSVFVDTNYVPNRWAVRFYAAFESLDFDGDGLNDVIESQFVGTSTNSADHDNDGQGDFAEFFAGCMPTISNVWWLTTTTNHFNYWEYVGYSNAWTNPPAKKFSANAVGAAPVDGWIVDDIRIDGYVDDMISVDWQDINACGGPTNFTNYSIADILPSPQSGFFKLELFDYPAPGHTGHNEVRLGDTNGDFQVMWDWCYPLEMKMEPILSTTQPPLDNPGGIILGSNATFHVDVHPLMLVPNDKIVWTSVYHKVAFTPTNRGWKVDVVATNAGDDELRVTVEDAIGDFNLPPFHVKVVPLTVVTAKVGVVKGPDGLGAISDFNINQAFSMANAILAQAGMQLEPDLPAVSIPYENGFWDVDCNSSKFDQLLTNITTSAGIKVYFVNSILTRSGHPGAGVNSPYGMLISGSWENDKGQAIAHETGHGSGLHDLYPENTNELLYAMGEIRQEWMPDDWGYYTLLSEQPIQIQDFMQQILMYWAGFNGDIPSGRIFGVWYDKDANGSTNWYLTNAPVGLSDMTNIPSHQNL